MRAVGVGPIPVSVVFGLVSFAAAATFGAAFDKAFPHLDRTTYYSFIMLFPVAVVLAVADW